MGRGRLDPYIEERLLAERGDLPHGNVTVRDCWHRAWANEPAKREVLLSQLDSFRIRRGGVGNFDPARLLINWRPSAAPATEPPEAEAEDAA